MSGVAGPGALVDLEAVVVLELVVCDVVVEELVGVAELVRAVDVTAAELVDTVDEAEIEVSVVVVLELLVVGLPVDMVVELTGIDDVVAIVELSSVVVALVVMAARPDANPGAAALRRVGGCGATTAARAPANRPTASSTDTAPVVVSPAMCRRTSARIARLRSPPPRLRNPHPFCHQRGFGPTQTDAMLTAVHAMGRSGGPADL